MKQRFAAIDVSAIVSELKEKLVGLRLQNNVKEMLIIESGIRMHTTEYTREKSSSPSWFVTKLRKPLRSKRLSAIRQVGIDRIVDFQFGDDEFAYHLIVEFYASGNIILTDHEYKILVLLRQVSVDGAGENNQDVKFAVGETYPMNFAKTFQLMTIDRIKAILQKKNEEEQVEEEIEEMEQGKSSKDNKQQKKANKKNFKDGTLKKIVKSSFGLDYGPSLVEHVLDCLDVDPSTKITKSELLENESILKKLLVALQEADKIFETCMKESQKGYIILKEFSFGNNKDKKLEIAASIASSTLSLSQLNLNEKENVSYDEFHPFKLNKKEEASSKIDVQEFNSFNKCVDEFFSKYESQRLLLKTLQAEHQAAKKLEAVQKSHQAHIDSLEQAKLDSIQTAVVIERNTQIVDNVIAVVRNLVATGMDWKDIGDMVEEEKRKNNYLASFIHGLKLNVGMVTLTLPEPQDFDDEENENIEEYDDEDDGQSHKKSCLVDVDIYISAYANATSYYEAKKTYSSKQKKTINAAGKAIESAEKRIQHDLSQVQKTIPSNIVKTRKPYWFEKFLWFISSENFLCVGGRDSGQNEMLVKRYLKKGDIYIHADLHGASSVIIKNPYTSSSSAEDIQNGLLPPLPTNPDTCPIPPMTLHQAGTMSVCQSKAWDVKIVTSAWWVYDDQVSKTAPSGEYLTTGSFMIRGKKNWLPPVQLVYGFGILFKVDDDAVQKYLWERRPWARGDAQTHADALAQKYLQRKPLKSSHSSDDEYEDGDKDDTRQQETKNVSLIENQNHTKEEEKQEDNKNAEGDQKNEESSDSDQDLEFPDTQVNISTTSPTHAVSLKEESSAKESKNDLSDASVLDSDSDHESVGSSRSKSPNGKKHMSAKERRALKKAHKSGSGEVDSEPYNGSSEANKESEGKKGPSPPKRGKKGKMKKMKEKYADQDEEDRELMMELLGSNKGPQPKGKKAKNNVKKEEEAKKRKEQYEQRQKERERQQSSSQGSLNENEGDKNQQQHHDDPKKKENRSSSFSKEKDHFEDDDNDDENQNTVWNMLDYLTSTPIDDDELQHAIVVAGPWQAVQKYRYKVKLTPGSLKRGKAGQSAIAGFLGQASKEENGEKFKSLIKAIPENEVILTMLGKVKIA